MTVKPLLCKFRAAISVSALAVALSACGTTNWGFPYRAGIQQGNWITSEQVAQLRKGMTREQVRFILGTPTLQDIFRSDRWDYPYFNKPGYGKQQERKFTVWFNGDLLDHWDGDKQPDRQPFQKADTGMREPTPKPSTNETSNTDASANTDKSDSAIHPIFNSQSQPTPGAPNPASNRTGSQPLR